MKRKHLIALRLQYCGSQKRLADLVPVSRGEISNWENGHTTPYAVHVDRLCVILHCDDPIALLKIDEERSQSPPMNEQTRGLEILTKSKDETMGEQPPSLVLPHVTVSPALQQFIAASLSCRLQHIAHTNYPTPEDMTHTIQRALKEFDTMNPNHEITRRSALVELAALPLVTLGQQPDTRHQDELLKFCTASLEACWQLYRGSDPIGTKHAFECCSTYVPLLETIAHDSSRHRKQALDLAAQYAILQTMLGWNYMGARETIIHAQNAFYLSKESRNILLQLSASTKLSFTYFRSENYIMALKTMQEGEHALKSYQRKKHMPPLPVGVIGNFYSSYSLAQVNNGIDPDTALGIAADSEPLNEPVALMEFDAYDQWWEAATTCNSRGNSRQAMKWLERIIDPETLVSRIPQSEGRRITSLLSLASILLQSPERDMGQIIRVWTASMEGAKVLRGEQKYRNAMTNFAIMRALYPGERAIRELMPLTSHW